MGDMECALEARTKDEEYTVNIKLNERTYDEKELEEVFRKGKEWLDKVWLGENVSSDQVVSDLYFPAVIETLGLNVRWETSNYNWIQTDGSITELGFKSAPARVEVNAVLSYGTFEKRYTYAVTIRRSEQTTEDSFEEKLNEAVVSAEKSSAVDIQMKLPTEIDGQAVSWYRQKSKTWIRVFLFGNLILVLLYFSNEEKKVQQIKDRNSALNQDYPDIVYRLIVLIGAGMTVKNAWEKVIEVYEREKIHTGKMRWGYEEMEAAQREMLYGISEIKAYENFGKRCGGQNYMRLSELLIQQVRRGSKGMNQLLMQEVAESEIIWRESSRKKAEEAGMKLLLPMVLLMTVVFAVLMIPAFLTMSL